MTGGNQRSWIAIERKDRDPAAIAAAAATLRAALLGAARLVVTPAEATALSGLPLDVSREALFHLAARYPAHIVVDATGAPGFAFDSLARRRQPPWQPALAAARAWYGRHADAAMGVFTLAVLPALLWAITGNLGALIAALPDARGPGGLLEGWLGWVVFAALVPTTLAMMLVAGLALLFCALPLAALYGLGSGLWDLAHGLGRHTGGSFALAAIAGALSAGFAFVFVVGEEKRWARDLWGTVGGLLFGPALAPADALADERRLTALIVARGGVLTVVDLVALFGWTVAQAESELARVLVDYGGDLAVAPSGAILYLFDPLRLAAADLPLAADLAPAFEREIAYRPFFGCARWLVYFATLAGGLGLAGLAMHPLIAVFPTPASWLALTGPRDIQLLQGLGAWIYLAALLPIIVRLPGWLLGRLRWPERRRFLDLVAVAVRSPAGVPAGAARARDVVALGGEIGAGPDSGPLVAFPAFERAARAASDARADGAWRASGADIG